jgi:seryl-tRNA synthetase
MGGYEVVMTDEELVARLRDLGDHAHFEPSMHYTAADAIERLRARVEKAEAVRDAIGRQLAAVTAAHEKAERELKTVLDRESASIARWDAKAEKLERERDEAFLAGIENAAQICVKYADAAFCVKWRRQNPGDTALILASNIREAAIRAMRESEK